MSEQNPVPDSDLQTPLPDQEIDLAPDHDEPGDTELSPELADLASNDTPPPDEVDERPDTEIEVEDS